MSDTTSTSNPPKAAESDSQTQPLLILVDGHSLAFRSYFAFAKGRDGGLKTKTGIPTSVCFGFLKSLYEVITSQQAQAIAIAFDTREPTFRHEAYADYKAGRTETPEDFITDRRNLEELLRALNLPIVTAPGYEADDVLGTLAIKGSAAGYRVKIVTGDRDLFQLVDPAKGISVLYLGNSFWQRSANAGPVEMGVEQVKQKLGITPAQVVDYKALCGDPSDNIPGVKGIGDKTAVKLLSEYGSLEQIYANLEQIKGAVKTKLETGKTEAYDSQHLAQIVLDLPLEVTLEDCQLRGFDKSVLEPILEKLEFKFYLGKIPQLQQAFGGQVSEESGTEKNNTSPDTTYLDAGETADTDDLWFFSAEDTKNDRQEKASPIQPQIIDTEEKLNALVKNLKTYTNPDTPIAWDTETTDIDPLQAELVGIGCCWGSEATDMAYVPVGHKTGKNLDQATVLDALRPILESDRYPKALQNAKFDRLVLRVQGIKLAGVIFDTMLASYVLNPENSHNLSQLSQRYLKITPKTYSDLVPKGKTIADIDIPSVADYCGMDAYTTFGIVSKLRTELAAVPQLHKLLIEVEQPLEEVLAEMEYTGIRINAPYLNELSEQLEKELTKIEQQAYEIAGEKFNFGSPKQLSELLFQKLQLDPKKSRKNQSGYSTDAATLEKLQGDHPVVDLILQYRTLAKLKSTYVDALPALMVAKTQRVHTDFNQTGTTTGRLSSSNPNLQNIPIRTAFSRQIRKGFVPEPGWLLVSADYSQIELRILAHLSQEPVLVTAYKQNEDIHTVTARLLFEKDTITSEERRLGKIINFGVIYGMGAQRFAREAGVKASEGKEFIEKFNQRYPAVFDYLESMKRNAIAYGYVETILHRRRYFNFEAASLRQMKGKKPNDIKLDELKRLGQTDAQLLRAAANAPIQGSSADIIKIAMAKLHNVLQNYQARLLLQVHDELVFEVPPEEVEELQQKIRSTMENAVQLEVPLVVDIRSGQNWMEAK
ncbi:MAG TPA: DNA polymerase I [Oculatellaceae cyanobacterium]|jgi:DNA polymerase-1